MSCDVGRGVAARFDGNELGQTPSHFHDRARSVQYALKLVQSLDSVHCGVYGIYTKCHRGDI